MIIRIYDKITCILKIYEHENGFVLIIALRKRFRNHNQSINCRLLGFISNLNELFRPM